LSLRGACDEAIPRRQQALGLLHSTFVEFAKTKDVPGFPFSWLPSGRHGNDSRI